MKKIPLKYWILLSVTLVVITVDQWTKTLIHAKFRWGETLPLWDSLFALTYVRNTGAAFGLMHRAPPAFRNPFFVIVPFFALVVIGVLFAKLKENQKWTAAALSLIVGGALGNLIDRLKYGFVIDFLDFHWRDVYHWPAFNVADSCIVVGVSIMFLLSLYKQPTQFQSVH